MNSNCQLCRMQTINPIMLICSHHLCLKCGENIQLQEHTSQIQNKFRIQCPKCRRLTHTYEIRNLLIESNELNLITDSSEMDREILNESSLCCNKQQQEVIPSRNINVYQPDQPAQIGLKRGAVPQAKLGDILNAQGLNNQQQTSSTTLNSSFQRKKQAGSEKISPTKAGYQAQPCHSKKQSIPNNMYMEPYNNASHTKIDKAKTMLNTSSNQQRPIDLLKPNTNTPNATPQSTPLAQQFNLNFQYTDNKKQFQPLISKYPIEFQQHRPDKLFQQDKEKSIAQLTQQTQVPVNQQLIEQKVKEKENQFQKESMNEVEQPRHKRSATGLPNNSKDPEVGSTQIVQQYFKMIQKNVSKLEQEMMLSIQNKQVDTSSLYARLKQLSTKVSDSEGELIQSIKVAQKLQQEINGLSTPSYHRKTSSHQNTSHRYTNQNTNTNTKTQEKSDHSTSSNQQDFKVYKKFL